SSPCFRLILMRRALMSTLFPYTTLFRSLYYGDTARVPYGSKDSNTVTRYALEAVEFFNGADVDCLVVACNTVSVTALEQMQKFSDRKSTRLNSSDVKISYAVFCLKKKTI